MDLRTIGLLAAAAGLAAAGTPALGQNYLGHGDRSRYRNPSAYSPASVVVGPRGSNQRAGDLRDQLWFNNQRSYSNSTGISTFRPYISYTPPSSQRFNPPPMPRTFVASPARSITVRSEPRSGTEFSAESWPGMNRSSEPQARETRRIRAYSEPSWQSSLEETAAGPRDSLFPRPERGSPGPVEPREFMSPAWPSLPPPIDDRLIRPPMTSVERSEARVSYATEADDLPIVASRRDWSPGPEWTGWPRSAENDEAVAANPPASTRMDTEGLRLQLYLSAGTQAMAAAEFARAEECFTKLIVSRPDHLLARRGRLEALLASAKYSAAYADLAYVLRVHPGWAESEASRSPIAQAESLQLVAAALTGQVAKRPGAAGFEAAALLSYLGLTTRDAALVEAGLSGMSSALRDASDPRAGVERQLRETWRSSENIAD